MPLLRNSSGEVNLYSLYLVLKVLGKEGLLSTTALTACGNRSVAGARDWARGEVNVPARGH